MLAVYTFWDVIWTMIIFFAFVMYLTWVVMLMVDNFKRKDHSGLAKGAWFVFMIFMPIVGPFTYTIARPHDADYGDVSSEYYTGPSASNSPAEQLSRLNELRTEGAITDAEYENLKQKALAGS